MRKLGQLTIVGIGIVFLTAGGCRSFGSRQVPVDSFDYNEAVSTSTNEQMLLNLVRLRYSEIPVFLALNSVLTQYIYAGNLDINGSSGELQGFPAWSVGGRAGIRYVERPTITYTPLSGQEFAAQLIQPVPADLVFSLVQSGWSPDQLMMMTLQRINDLENVSFGEPVTQEAVEQLRAFNRAMQLLIKLADQEAVGMIREEEVPGQEGAQFVFDPNASPESAAMIAEFKRLVDADPDRTTFRITTRAVRRQPDEMTVRIRSLLELMGFLSQGVEAPDAHVQEQRVAATIFMEEAPEAARPLRVVSQVDRPTPAQAFVAVQFQDHWFYIPHNDQGSKQAFGLLSYLFQMQAPKIEGAGPLVTVPTG